MKEKEEITKLINEYYANKDEASMNKILETFPDLQLLKDIREQTRKAIKEKLPIPKINNIYNLIGSENLIMISHYLLLKNKSVDKLCLNKVKNLSKIIISKTFKWDSIEKISVKRGRDFSRSMKIFNYSGKIIQSNIRFILEAIYEPIFEKYNLKVDSGSYNDCRRAIYSIIDYKNQGLNWVIEGDVKEIFDEIHPPTLAKVLAKYIKDKDFINIIYESLLIPIIKHNRIYTNETFQKSFIFSFLFNIYVYYFDQNIKKTIEEVKMQIYTRKSQSSKTKIVASKKSYLNETNYTTNNLRYHYTRFKNNFILLTNLNCEICEVIAKKIVYFSKDIFKFDLSLRKIKIINIKKDKLYYLGYAIFMPNERPIKSFTDNLLITTGKKILVGIDQNKLYNSLIKDKFAVEKSLKPRECPYLIRLEPQEILKYYNAKMLNIYNYYYGLIRYKSQLNRIWYILYFSAIKTLAAKYKSTTRKIYEQFGWKEVNNLLKFTNRVRIVVKYSSSESENYSNQKFVMLHNLQDMEHISKKIHLTNVFNIKKCCCMVFNNFTGVWKKDKVYWKTNFEMNGPCIICEFQKQIELLYVKEFNKLNFINEKTFLINRTKNLNRKLITICKQCYNNRYKEIFNNSLLKENEFIFSPEKLDIINDCVYENKKPKFLSLQRIVVNPIENQKTQSYLKDSKLNKESS